MIETFNLNHHLTTPQSYFHISLRALSSRYGIVQNVIYLPDKNNANGLGAG
jgi:hypothetical protein